MAGPLPGLIKHRYYAGEQPRSGVVRPAGQQHRDLGTEHDAERYLASYANAINAISQGRIAASPETADGISIKLSALFSRYEDAQRERTTQHELYARFLPPQRMRDERCGAKYAERTLRSRDPGGTRSTATFS